MSQNYTNNDASSIDYSTLNSNLKIDRWSPVSILAYILSGMILCCTLLILVAIIATSYVPAIVILLPAVVISFLCIAGARALFRRVDLARPDDLFSFAAINGWSAQSNPLTSHLETTVRIMLRYASFQESLPWRYTATFWLEGSYKSHPLSMYNVALDYGVLTDSPIEQGMQAAYYQVRDTQTSITLTLQRGGRLSFLAARQCGIILWTIPHLDLEAMKRIRRAARGGVEDIQANSNQLAILLPTTLPCEQHAMRKLYELLDRIYDAAKDAS